jgi:hypothetical protein
MRWCFIPLCLQKEGTRISGRQFIVLSMKDELGPPNLAPSGKSKPVAFQAVSIEPPDLYGNSDDAGIHGIAPRRSTRSSRGAYEALRPCRSLGFEEREVRQGNNSSFGYDPTRERRSYPNRIFQTTY